jgi:hypothetical protein
VYRTAAAPDVDYLDVSWNGQAVLVYGAATGVMLRVTYDVDDAQVVRGQGQVPALSPVGGHHNEILLDFGWRYANHTAFSFGLGVDLDPGPWPRGWFSGAEGAFRLYW